MIIFVWGMVGLMVVVSAVICWLAWREQKQDRAYIDALFAKARKVDAEFGWSDAHRAMARRVHEAGARDDCCPLTDAQQTLLLDAVRDGDWPEGAGK